MKEICAKVFAGFTLWIARQASTAITKLPANAIEIKLNDHGSYNPAIDVGMVQFDQGTLAFNRRLKYSNWLKGNVHKDFDDVELHHPDWGKSYRTTRYLVEDPQGPSPTPNPHEYHEPSSYKDLLRAAIVLKIVILGFAGGIAGWALGDVLYKKWFQSSMPSSSRVAPDFEDNDNIPV